MFQLLHKILICFLVLLLLSVKWAGADERLPAGVVPLHYVITLSPDLKTLTFRGDETIEINVLDPTRKIVVSSLSLQINKCTLLDKNAQNASIKLNDAAQTATFAFPQAVQKGKHILKISWEGKLDQKPRGLFYVLYSSASGKKTMLSTQFEAADARRMFPGWDEPAYKATYDLAARVPKTFLAVSNMPVKSEKDAGQDFKFVQFYTTPRMSSYLLVFVAGDLKFISGESDGVKIRVISPNGEEKKGEYALHSAENLLHFYDDYFQIKYPLPKLDLIAEPGGFGGAMENWGGITFNESTLLFDPKNSSQRTKEAVFEVVAHEMAHQWFGDLVTMKWWDDLWLNEGFADWMEMKATDHFNPEWHMRLRVALSTNDAMTTDALKTTHPIERPVASGSQADQLFDEITYSKASAVIRMIELYLGAENFQKGIAQYMTLHQFSNATSSDLWKALEDSSGKEVQSMAKGWVKQPGFPEAIIKSTCQNGEKILSLTQAPFYLMPSKSGSALQSPEWEIPVHLTAVGEQPFESSFVLGKEKIVSLGANSCSLPVLLEDKGYFRIHYDPDLFQELREVASSKLTDGQKVDFLYDSWAFAEEGSYPASHYFDLIQDFGHETDLAIWEEIVQSLSEINNLETNGSERERFHAYARELLGPVFKRTGWEKAKDEDEDENTTLLRTDLISSLGNFGDKKIIAEAFKRFHEFLRSPDSLASNLRRPVLRIVGRYGDQKTFNQIHSLGLKAKTMEEKMLYYGALTAAKKPELAQQALRITLTNELDPVNSAFNVLEVAYAGKHPDMAWKFTRKNLRAIEQKLPSMMIGFYFEGLISSFKGDKKGEEVASYALKHYPPYFSPVILKGLQVNRLSAGLKAHLLPQVNKWVSSHPAHEQLTMKQR